MHTRQVVAGLAIIATTGLTACSSSTDGTGSTVPTARSSASASSTPPPAAAPSSETPSETPSQTPTPTPTTSQGPAKGLTERLCGFYVASPAGAVDCIRDTMTAFWTKDQGRTVTAQVSYLPQAEQVPAACRPALVATIAFYCEVDDTIVLGPRLATEITQYGKNADYGLVSVLAHEVGHRVQDTVHQPGFTSESNPSVKLEQQADCLSGVWAEAEATAGKLDPSIFVSVTHEQLNDVSDNPEIYTHGTPVQRIAAVQRGMAGGTAACGLGKPL